MHANRFQFRPDSERAALLDAEVREQLADSLSVLLGVLEAQGVAATGKSDLLRQIRGGAVSPRTFALYTALAEATLEAEFGAAQRILSAITARSPTATGRLTFVTLGPPALDEQLSELYLQMVNDDPSLPLAIEPLEAEEFEAARHRVEDALALIDGAAPDLMGEIDALLSEIVLVKSGSNSSGREIQFDGASSFYLWGAIFLNATDHRNRIAIAEGLAHESAHMLLFGLSKGAPLVENPPDECFPSPLRHDPRPMDGIVHATYVLARMHYCLERLLRNGDLAERERIDALTAMDYNRRAYIDGLKVVHDHARLTPVGKSAFEEAQGYMTEALAVTF